MDSGPRGRGLMAQGPGFLGTVATSQWVPIPISEASFRTNPTAKQGKPQAFFGGI